MMTFGKDSPFNGDKYEGEFTNGKPNGKGTYTKANGVVYKGSLKNGVPHGEGTLTSPDGKTKTGSWEEGKELKVQNTPKVVPGKTKEPTPDKTATKPQGGQK